MCCLLVSGFLTEITQQIHSFRASGVISSHLARAAGSEIRTFRKSAGTLCTAPGEIVFVTGFILIVTWGQKYNLCLRNTLLPMPPERTAKKTVGAIPPSRDFACGLRRRRSSWVSQREWDLGSSFARTARSFRMTIGCTAVCFTLLLFYRWSGREDLNLRPPAPKAGALPGCATPRQRTFSRF